VESNSGGHEIVGRASGTPYPIHLTVPPAALGPTVTLVYQYTGDSVRPAGVSASIDGVPDYCNTYTYDGQGRLVRIVQTGQPNGNAVANKQIDLAYRTDGQLATVCRYQDGQLAVEANYAYDSLGRLTGLVYHQGETVLASYDWTYSGTASPVVGSSSAPAAWAPNGGLPLVDGLPIEAGRGMLPVQDTAGVVSALLAGAYNAEMATTLVSCTSLDGTVAYTYDATGQLTAADYSGDQPDERYSYDANGNRTGAGYVVGPDNQLLCDGTYRYTYDADGNRASRFVWTDADLDGQIDQSEKSQITEYSWDARNRLAVVTKRAAADGPATEIDQYFYDLENRWIGETIDTDGDGRVDHETRFVYDGNQIIMQFDKDGSGNLTGADLSHRYVWGAAVDQTLADERVSGTSVPGQVVWPVTDQLGTVRDLAVLEAQTGVTSIANHRVYDSYGVLKSQTNAAVDELFGFTGRPLDEATGSQNNLNRWYDAVLGRWMSEDPSGFGSRDTNLYRYCVNGVNDSTDPTGLENKWPTGLSRNTTLEQVERMMEEAKARGDMKTWLRLKPAKKALSEAKRLGGKGPGIRGPRGGGSAGCYSPVNPLGLLLDALRILLEAEENGRSFEDQEKYEQEETPWIMPGMPNPNYNPRHVPLPPGQQII
jgi:RHS repeat-associated protein